MVNVRRKFSGWEWQMMEVIRQYTHFFFYILFITFYMYKSLFVLFPSVFIQQSGQTNMCYPPNIFPLNLYTFHLYCLYTHQFIFSNRSFKKNSWKGTFYWYFLDFIPHLMYCRKKTILWFYTPILVFYFQSPTTKFVYPKFSFIKHKKLS